MSASSAVAAGTDDITAAEPGKSDQPSPRKIQTRIYRACVHCRQRKSKCDLESIGEPGRPPCKRCVREQRECVLAGSRRGGRRVRKAKKLEGGSDQTNSLAGNVTKISNLAKENEKPDEGRWPPGWQSAASNAEAYSQYVSLNGNLSVEKTIASAEIQNPSDALEILAQVAGDAGTADRATSTAPASDVADSVTSSGSGPTAEKSPLFSFPPFTNGIMTISLISELLIIYHRNNHLFFPIAPEETFNPANLSRVVSEAPHLFAAILTVASADYLPNSKVHQQCLSHVQSLISDLIYGCEGSIQAVEALLILAEWSNWHHGGKIKPGKGRESASAWMLVGTAVRLGYLLGLDRTAFRNDSAEPVPLDLHRRRLVWSACYMSDRQNSIRVGRGFWSRGPGPLTGFQPSDFPSLAKAPEGDDYANIFKANLELTQLFGNAHDILYSNRGRELKLILAGDYVKYIDDFRAGIRAWHSVYGTLTCSSRVKVSLLLTYDYLRLYVNAFAFQAALTRLISGERDMFTQKSVATEPDARFIYESVDAAKSILTTVNNFVDPQTCLRYLPLRYYLYIVHGTVFLYKALATGTMSAEEKDGVRRMVVETVTRLQKSSTSTAHVGARYAKLISLLWKRPPKQNDESQVKGQDGSSLGSRNVSGTNIPSAGVPNVTGMPLSTFSWLDLDSVGNFAAQNNATNFSPGYADLNFMPEDLAAVTVDGIDSQQWFNDTNPGYVF